MSEGIGRKCVGSVRGSSSERVNRRRQVVVAGAVLLAAAGARRAAAADGTWNGSTTDTLWQTAGNWNGGTIAGNNSGVLGTSTDSAFFNTDPTATPGPATVAVDLDRNVKNIDVGASPVAIRIGPATVNTGNTLYLSNGGTFSNSGGVVNADLSAPVQLTGATYTLLNNTTAFTTRTFGDVVARQGGGTVLTLDGIHGSQSSSQAEIDGALLDNPLGGALSVVKNGTGVWEVNTPDSRPSTYSGDTTVNAGILRSSTTGSTNGLGGFSPNSHYIVNNGGTLRNSVPGSTIKKVTLNFGGILNGSNANSTLLNVKSESGAAINLNFGTPTSSSPISLNLPLALTGATADHGGVTLTAAGGPTGTGAVTFGSSTGFFNTGTVRRIFDIGKGADANVDYDLRIQGIVQGSGGFVKKGAGTLRFNGHQAATQSTITGTIEVQEGTFNPSATNMFANQPNLLVSGGRLLLQSGQSQTFGAVSMTKGEMTGGDNNVTVQGAGFVLSPAGTDTARVDVILANGASPANLSKSGTGTATIEIAPTYTGTTTVSAGTLSMATNATLPSITVSGGTFEVKVSNTDGLRAVSAGAVSVTGSGRIDVTKHRLITTTALGTESGGVYSGVQGLVQSAANFGAWDGPGITTSQPDAVGGLTSIGVATGEQMLGLGPTDTALFSGQTISGASTVAMYTYAGDANLDGFISGDDYAAIDFNIAVPGSDGWYNGDFNWDGIISGDDYAAIDFNIVAQGAAFATSGSTALSGVSAVPEPASLAVLGLPAIAAGLRRRRSRLKGV